MSVEKLATGVMYFWISFKFNYFIHEETEKNRQVFVKSKGAKFQFMSKKKRDPKKPHVIILSLIYSKLRNSDNVLRENDNGF